MTYGFGFMIESLVATLLLLTIAYCIILNGRLKRLKADEQALKATIAELITATEIAERAVAGLKTTAQECDQTLGERLRTAERCCVDLNRQIKSGDLLIKRLSRIVAAGGDKSAETACELDPAFDAEPAAAQAIEPAAAPANDAVLDPAAVPARASAPKALSGSNPKAVAAAAQAVAERARTRLSKLAA